MSSNPIVLVLGSGPRIGASIASLFSSSNYRVAIASRKAIAGTTPEGYLSIPADLSSPSSLSSIFSTVSSRFHQSPSIVIYNAAALTPPRDDDLFTIPIDNLSADLNVNTVSVYAAMQETVKGWETFKGEEAGRKCFIFTGNKQNTYIGPMLMTLTLGMGKSATAYLIGAADAKYKDLGYRFV
jgi:NAD(P)-dependent dehydrogenase (short-subunit alcohol dehydrogenase family)